MNDRMREVLLGYVLGALDESERAELEARLRADSDLRWELTRLKEELAPLEALKHPIAPPPGLAARTCDYVFDHVAQSARVRRRAAGNSARWLLGVRRADVAVAAALLVAAFCVLVPAIQSSRFRSQVMTCQDNLRDIGVALTQFSEAHDGFFPTVPTRGKLAAAGIYAPKLANDRLLSESRRICCPGSSLGPVDVPRLSDLEKATESQIAGLLPTLGGSYGYTLGHLVNGIYQDTKNLRRPTFAILADMPGEALPGRQSLSHAGRGENVLFEDGHVQFLAESRPFGLADDIYSNDLGHIGAGSHLNDSVIVPGNTAPIVPVSLP